MEFQVITFIFPEVSNTLLETEYLTNKTKGECLAFSSSEKLNRNHTHTVFVSSAVFPSAREGDRINASPVACELSHTVTRMPITGTPIKCLERSHLVKCNSTPKFCPSSAALTERRKYLQGIPSPQCWGRPRGSAALWKNTQSHTFIASEGPATWGCGARHTQAFGISSTCSHFITHTPSSAKNLFLLMKVLGGGGDCQ